MTVGKAVWLSVADLRRDHPKVYYMFFAPYEDVSDRPGYAKFRQIGLQLKAKANLDKSKK